MVTQRCFA